MSNVSRGLPTQFNHNTIKFGLFWCAAFCLCCRAACLPSPGCFWSPVLIARAITPVRLSTSMMSTVATSCTALASKFVSAAAAPAALAAQASSTPGASSMVMSVVAIAMVLAMVHLIALCSSCFGGSDESESGGASTARPDGANDDEVIAYEAPDTEVKAVWWPPWDREALSLSAPTAHGF